MSGSVGECPSAHEVEGPRESLEVWPELACEGALMCPETCRCYLGHSREVSSILQQRHHNFKGLQKDYSCACVPLLFSSFSLMPLLLQVAPPACPVPQASPERRQLSPGESDRLHTTETAKGNHANIVFLIPGGQELRQQRHFSRTAAPLGCLPCKIFSGGI